MKAATAIDISDFVAKIVASQKNPLEELSIVHRIALLGGDRAIQLWLKSKDLHQSI